MAQGSEALESRATFQSISWPELIAPTRLAAVEPVEQANRPCMTRSATEGRAIARPEVFDRRLSIVSILLSCLQLRSAKSQTVPGDMTTEP